MKKNIVLSALLFGLSIIMVSPINADFIQCTAQVSCNGTDNNDVVNGSAGIDFVNAGPGNDIIFGADDQDIITGVLGNDIIFGGRGSDLITGLQGDDVVFPGPDDMTDGQSSFGIDGNDTFNILVGETANCQFLVGNEGFDVVNLIGFGPYSAVFPFGVQNFAADSSIVLQDPIAGGYIFITVSDQDDNTVEVINGLMSPNVAIVPLAESVTMVNELCEIISR